MHPGHGGHEMRTVVAADIVCRLGLATMASSARLYTSKAGERMESSWPASFHMRAHMAARGRSSLWRPSSVRNSPTRSWCRGMTSFVSEFFPPLSQLAEAQLRQVE